MGGGLYGLSVRIWRWQGVYDKSGRTIASDALSRAMSTPYRREHEAGVVDPPSVNSATREWSPMIMVSARRDSQFANDPYGRLSSNGDGQMRHSRDGMALTF